MEEGATVTFFFVTRKKDDRGNDLVGRVELPWRRGKSVHRFFTESPLKEFHLLGLRSYIRLENGSTRLPITLAYEPRPGDIIDFTKKGGR